MTQKTPAPITHFSRFGLSIDVTPKAITVHEGAGFAQKDFVILMRNVSSAYVEGLVKQHVAIEMNNGKKHKFTIGRDAMALLGGINAALAE